MPFVEYQKMFSDSENHRSTIMTVKYRRNFQVSGFETESQLITISKML